MQYVWIDLYYLDNEEDLPLEGHRILELKEPRPSRTARPCGQPVGRGL